MCRAYFASLSSSSKSPFGRFRPKLAIRGQHSSNFYIRRFLIYAPAWVSLAIAASFANSQNILSAFEQQALLAFNPGAKVFNSLTLRGDVVWTSGSLKEDGSVVFKAAIDGSTSETWTLPTQSHSSTDSALKLGRSCIFTDHAGAVHANSDPNCLRSVPWFAPWMGVGLVSSSTILGSDTSLSTDLANGVRKLSFRTGFTASNSLPTALKSELTLLQTRTAVTVSYDQLTALPSGLSFVQVLDSDPVHVIPYQVLFSDFRPEAGYVIPHRIQRYVQRTLQADITITSATAE